MDFDDLKPWLIGILGVAVAVSAVFGMINLNVNSAISRCENAGYSAPEKKMSVTTCEFDEDYAHDSVALVVGNVANSPAPTVTDEVELYLQNSYTDESQRFFAFSATPSGMKISTNNKKTKKSNNVGSFIRNSQKRLDSLNKSIKQPPIEDGVDYFNNIIAAANAAKTSPKVENPLVIVIGSGLSDTQPLNFANSDLLHSDPKQVIERLKSTGIISPNQFMGLKIMWSGLGITVAPQQPLDAQERSNLRKIYQGIFEYMGANFVTDDTVMAADSVDTDNKVQLTKVHGISGGVVVYKFGENSIGFMPDSAKITDISKANAALSGVLESYKKCHSVKVTVEGYQARPDGKITATSPLSQSRADAVKSILVSMGINSQAVTAIGKGSSDFEGRQEESNKEGVWDSTRAQANRIVLVTLKDGEGCSN